MASGASASLGSWLEMELQHLLGLRPWGGAQEAGGKQALHVLLLTRKFDTGLADRIESSLNVLCAT